MNWPLSHFGPVPERMIEDPSATLPTGYAQSKYVSEQVLSRATETAGIPATVCRVGQIAGPVRSKDIGGSWNKQEWLPSLIASSKYLGQIPNSLGSSSAIDWIPVDVLSRVLVELLENSGTDEMNNASVNEGGA